MNLHFKLLIKLFPSRNSILGNYSCTDLKQKWGTMSKRLASSYQNVHLSEMHCMKKVKRISVIEPTVDQLAEFRNEIIRGNFALIVYKN